MTFTIENTQNDSAAIAIDGYDVAQIQRISFAAEELNDAKWQQLLDTLDTASHFKTLIDAARGAVEAWSDREGDDEVDAMSHLKSVINQIPSDRVSRYLPSDDEPPLKGEGEIVINQSLSQYKETFRDQLYRRCGILMADIDEREIDTNHRLGIKIADAITAMSSELGLHDADEDAWCEEFAGVRPDRLSRNYDVKIGFKDSETNTTGTVIQRVISTSPEQAEEDALDLFAANTPADEQWAEGVLEADSVFNTESWRS